MIPPCPDAHQNTCIANPNTPHPVHEAPAKIHNGAHC